MSVTTLEHNGNFLRPSWGTTQPTVQYFVAHTKHARKNVYLVEVEIRGMETGDIYLDWDGLKLLSVNHIEVGKSEDGMETNDETLTLEGVQSLCEDTFND